MEIDKIKYDKAFRMAINVDFLDKNDFRRYMSALYDALVWEEEIEKKNKSHNKRRK